MSGPPLVSIVTPSLNQGRFLRKTIHSILRQSYPHIQYIVVDGGSTDSSLEVLRSYDRRLTWTSEPDGGQADALNKGFRQARGEILAYVNSDDVLLPNAVEKVVDGFLAHPDWQIIYGRAHLIDEDDRFLGEYPTKPFTFRRLAEESCICQPAAFWRAGLRKSIGDFDAGLHFCMDYDYWLRAAQRGARFEYIDDLLAHSRTYPETKTNSGRLAMYCESIALCRKRAGEVSAGPFRGLWRHFFTTHRSIWVRTLGRVPGLMANVARVHRWWINSMANVQ